MFVDRQSDADDLLLHHCDFVMRLVDVAAILPHAFVKDQFDCAAVGRNPDRTFFKAALPEQRFPPLLVCSAGIGSIDGVPDRTVAIDRLRAVLYDGGGTAESAKPGCHSRDTQVRKVEDRVIPT